MKKDDMKIGRKRTGIPITMQLGAGGFEYPRDLMRYAFRIVMDGSDAKVRVVHEKTLSADEIQCRDTGWLRDRPAQ